MLSAATLDPLQVPIWIDLAAVVVGALTGASVAVRERLDVVGVLFLAVVMGLGGGIIRDVLLGAQPVALSGEGYLPVVAAAAVVGFFFGGLVARFDRVLTVLDALSIALFTVVGVEKALLFDLAPAAAMFIGVASAVGGGILRDVVTDLPVLVVRRGPWNAAAALVGTVVYVVLEEAGAPSVVAEAATFATVVTTRLLSVFRGWETPLPVDLTESLRARRRAAARRWRRPPPPPSP